MSGTITGTFNISYGYSILRREKTDSLPKTSRLGSERTFFENCEFRFLNINDNQLPGIYRKELFLERCKELLSTPEVADGTPIDWLKREVFG
jgi:hypothetical protein